MNTILIEKNTNLQFPIFSKFVSHRKRIKSKNTRLKTKNHRITNA